MVKCPHISIRNIARFYLQGYYYFSCMYRTNKLYKIIAVLPNFIRDQN